MIKPCGWRVLVEPRKAEEKTAGGILLPDQTRDTLTFASSVAQVIDIGDDAYSDPDKFSKPWVQIGDWIMIGKYAGHSFMVDGDEFRLLNDDEIIAIVEDPATITV